MSDTQKPRSADTADETSTASLAGRLGLVAVMALVVALTLHLMLTDQRPLRSDAELSYVPTVTLRQAVESGQASDWRRWLVLTEYRPPLPMLAALPAMLCLQDQFFAIRLTELLAFLCLLLVVYRLGCSLAGPLAGAFAGLCLVSVSLIRAHLVMGNADAWIWLTTMLLFATVWKVDLRSYRQGAFLGLVVGACLYTRLITLVFLIGPLVWLVAARLRSRRQLLVLIWAAAWSLLLCGWWYIAQFGAVWDNAIQSSTAQQEVAPAMRSLVRYHESGLTWWLGLTVVAAVVVRVLGVMSWRKLGLFGLWLGVPIVQLAAIWDVWERYPLPMLAPCAVLVAVALDAGLRRLPSPVRYLGWSVAALAVIWSAWPTVMWQLQDEAEHHRQYDEELRPDRRPYQALSRVMQKAPDGVPLLMLDATFPSGWIRAQSRRDAPHTIWTAPDGDSVTAIPPELKVEYTVHVRWTCRPGQDLYRTVDCSANADHPEWPALTSVRQAKPLARAEDPDGVTAELYRLHRPLSGGELGEVMGQFHATHDPEPPPD